MMIYHVEAANEVQSIAVPYEERRRWSLNRDECIQLAQMALKIADYLAKPMDIEWAKDGVTGDLFIVQARPETIHSKAQSNKMTIYKIDEKFVDSLKKQGEFWPQVSSRQTHWYGKVRLYRTHSEVLKLRENYEVA